MKKVLIVEDLDFMQKQYAIDFYGIAQVFAARTLKQTKELLSKHPDFDIIFWDENIGDHSPHDLIKATQEYFKGPMVGISCEGPHGSAILSGAGIRHHCYKSKLVETFNKLLGPASV